MHQDIFTHELETWRKCGARIIDVREPDEYASEHIPGTVNLPLSQLEVRAVELSKDLNAPLVIVCRSGGRSSNACEYLSVIGHTNLANLQGGTMAWAMEGRSLETGLLETDSIQTGAST
jgi:rhodanese-related sulfurtransferase